jgi:hypothetical protein
MQSVYIVVLIAQSAQPVDMLCICSTLTCRRQYNICRRIYSLLAANSLQSNSLYTYCAKSYSESRYSSLNQCCQPPGPCTVPLLLVLRRFVAAMPCLQLGDVRLCCAARSMNDRNTSSISSYVVCSGATILSSSIEPFWSATCT